MNDSIKVLKEQYKALVEKCAALAAAISTLGGSVVRKTRKSRKAKAVAPVTVVDKLVDKPARRGRPKKAVAEVAAAA